MRVVRRRVYEGKPHVSIRLGIPALEEEGIQSSYLKHDISGIDGTDAEKANGKILVCSDVRAVAGESGTDARVEAVGSYKKSTCSGRGVGETGFD